MHEHWLSIILSIHVGVEDQRVYNVLFFPLRDEQVESSLTLNKHAGIHFSNNYLDKV